MFRGLADLSRIAVFASDWSGGPPPPFFRLARDTRGSVPCHKAASMILIPSKVLQQELKMHPPSDAGSVVEAANRFEVSVEVMLRRLHDVGVFDQDWVPVLARRQKSGLTVEFAAYPRWLKSRLTQPSKGVSFNDWFRGSEQLDGKFVRKASDHFWKRLP